MPTKPFQPSGVWPALATPFTDDGKIDLDRYRRLIEFTVDQGVTGVLPCGTTGESPTLSWQEHEDLVGTAIDTVDGKVGVLAGTGSNNTQEAIRGTEDAHRRGAAAALLVDCYYNGPSSLELRTEYYERVLNAVPDIPLVPYVIPGRTGCALGAEDLAMLHLSAPDRVPAVKQATGDLDRMRRDRELAGPGLAIMSGDDDMTLPMMNDPAISASGVISVMGNLVPKALSDMVAARAATMSLSAFGTRLPITLITPEAEMAGSFIIGSVMSSSPLMIARPGPASSRSRRMRSRSPVACFTAGTRSGALRWSMARSSAPSAQPVRPGIT